MGTAIWFFVPREPYRGAKLLGILRHIKVQHFFLKLNFVIVYLGALYLWCESIL